MHIIAGMKQVEQVRGMVADFCPICREVRAFQLIRIGLVSHIYYVSSGAGTLAGYVIRCNECGLRLKTDSDRYAVTEKDSRVGIEALGVTRFRSCGKFMRRDWKWKHESNKTPSLCRRTSANIFSWSLLPC
jgi:hypothetical protein